MKAVTYVKMAVAGAVCCIGGPAFVMWVQPDPDELFQRYNPELQKKVLSEREQRLKAHEEHMAMLREYSKSNKPIWIVAAEAEKAREQKAREEKKRIAAELEKQRLEILEEQRKAH
ncbi:hypothetical protein BZA77DRAFT_326710 [Pyronema omphalodes]|nr:hypothetical protein BZA77DRAFT_326710 [Pyronema omphalodes]